MNVRKSDGTALFCEEHGTGDPSIIIDHRLGTSEHFRHQVDHFASRYRVIVPDLAGFGRPGFTRSSRASRWVRR